MSRQITAEEFVDTLRAYGVQSLTGVPRGHLAGPVGAVREHRRADGRRLGGCRPGDRGWLGTGGRMSAASATHNPGDSEWCAR